MLWGGAVDTEVMFLSRREWRMYWRNLQICVYHLFTKSDLKALVVFLEDESKMGPSLLGRSRVLVTVVSASRRCQS